METIVVHKGVPVHRNMIKLEKAQKKNTTICARIPQTIGIQIVKQTNTVLDFHEKADNIRNIDMLRKKYENWPNNSTSVILSKEDHRKYFSSSEAFERTRDWILTSKFQITPVDLIPWSSEMIIYDNES